MDSLKRDDFWASIRRTAADVEHRLNLAGKWLVACVACNGSGYKEPSRTDWDAHGSYWVPQVDCRSCGGRGRVEVACPADVEAAAIKREIGTLQARLRKLEGGG
jgi:hypothetical protein